ncbi:MAG: oligoendopeptidase F [Clostridia bacterium]|nr:oligoendopeptidase F [Clostridia bacterium]
MRMIKNRKEIKDNDKWDIQAMYPDKQACESDMKQAVEMAHEYQKYKGKIGNSSEVLLHAFIQRDQIWQKAEKVYVYSRMKRDEDNRISEYQALCDKAQTMIANISELTSFFLPEFSEIPEEVVAQYQKAEPGLDVYSHIIDELLRNKLHVLSLEEENLLAKMGELFSATNDTFTMLNNADINFGSIQGEDGQETEVTHGNYVRLMQSKDREVRKRAYGNMYEAYEKQKNTLATLYNYNTKQDVIFSKIRKYPSSLEAALFSDNVPLGVYDHLLQEVHEALPVLHRYINLRKKLLKADRLNMYDFYVPLVEQPKEQIPYKKAQELMKKALIPLGNEYSNILEKSFKERWADVYESEGKTSGAYSFGSYDSLPYLLLNYDGRIEDVFTLAHEMGHSMHSYYTRMTQPFAYGSHSIFTAEVASTVNEALLMRYLISNAKNAQEKAYFLNMHLEGFRTTLFRQTMFAEFERMTHQTVEEGGVLTAAWLSEKYAQLNKKYHGPGVEYDDHISMEWSRIPHFYHAFYVYKYATGYSAAMAISERILSLGDEASAAYVAFLKSGESDYPIELLKIAGVDMSTPKPVHKALKTFESLLEEFERLV